MRELDLTKGCIGSLFWSHDSFEAVDYNNTNNELLPNKQGPLKEGPFFD